GPDFQTLSGVAIGTLPYCPPEQANGELSRIDKRADVFGLGAILCELLTGEPPYAGTKAEVLAQAKAGDLARAFARLRAIRVEKELVALAKRCLSADPAARPADAGAVANAVSAYKAGWSNRLKKAETSSIETTVREDEKKTSLGKL